jgi:hypothetical protein
MDVAVEGIKINLLFFILNFLIGSQLMLMEMSPLLYDFAIDVSKQVYVGLIFFGKQNELFI